MTNVLKKYNTEDTLLVLSSYPRRNETYSKGVCAVASFTKNTLKALQKKNPAKKIVVLTMTLDQNKPELYEEEGMLIVRCFTRNKPLTFLNIVSTARKFSKAKNLLVEFEFASFGDTISTGSLAGILWMLAISGKKLTIVMHQVLLDIAKLSGHVGIASQSILTPVFNTLLKIYYFAISLSATSIVVLEDTLKVRLSQIVPASKISVIPHGVDTSLASAKLTKKIARKSLGIAQNEFVVLYFGYIAWYKGVDILLQTFLKNRKLGGKKIKLILAGGPSFTQENKSHYRKYFEKVARLVLSNANIEMTGFVDEKDIPNYFTASDLVVFPYRTFMSSSGPFSTALSFGKPFLLSKALTQFVETQDIKNAMIELEISKQDIMFDLSGHSFLKALKIAGKPTMYNKLAKLSMILQEKRSFENLALDYAKIVFKEEEKARKSVFYPPPQIAVLK